MSEPQNTILSGYVRYSQRKQIYKQLGGEQACHDTEVMLNSLVCLTAQFTKELARVEGFLPIATPNQSNWTEDGEVCLESVQDPHIQKLAKYSLFRGGIQNI